MTDWGTEAAVVTHIGANWGDYALPPLAEPSYRPQAKSRRLESMSGEELRTLRRAMNLTQDQLASLLDVTRVTVCQYEKGHARVPKVVQLAMETLRMRAHA